MIACGCGIVLALIAFIVYLITNVRGDAGMSEDKAFDIRKLIDVLFSLPAKAFLEPDTHSVNPYRLVEEALEEILCGYGNAWNAFEKLCGRPAKT